MDNKEEKHEPAGGGKDTGPGKAADAPKSEEKKGKGTFGRLFSGFGSVLGTTAHLVDLVLDIEILKTFGRHFATQAGDVVGKGAKHHIKKLHREGNFREFNQAMSLLTIEEFEFIDELMSLMTNEEQERFQQQMALTGETIEDTAAILRKLTHRGTHAQALAYLRRTDYLQKPTSEPKRIADRMVGDMSTVRAEARSFLDEINNDIAGVNRPQGGVQ